MRQKAPHLALWFLTDLPDLRFGGWDSGTLPKILAHLRKSSFSDIDAVVDALDSSLRGVRINAIEGTISRAAHTLCVATAVGGEIRV